MEDLLLDGHALLPGLTNPAVTILPSNISKQWAQVRRDTESALDSSIRKQQAAFDEAETRHQEAASELQSSRDPSNQQHKKLVKQRDALLESAKGENHKLVALQAIQSSLPDTFREAQQTAEQGGEQKREPPPPNKRQSMLERSSNA